MKQKFHAKLAKASSRKGAQRQEFLLADFAKNFVHFA